MRLGTRSSKLAMWQARWVADCLSKRRPDLSVEFVPLETRGDSSPGNIVGVGDSGLFTSALEEALLRGHIDLAVHSLKDLPVEPNADLVVAAVPLRSDPCDVLLSRDGLTLTELPPGARVGTSSPRRTCLLRARRPDIDVVPIRGNVDTRVRSVEEGVYDAIVLAAAGVARLALETMVSERFDPSVFPPAPGQGALAVQVRRLDSQLVASAAELDDRVARRTTVAERAFLSGLGGGCSSPIGAHAWGSDEELSLVGFVGSLDGRRTLRGEARGEGPEALGADLASRLLDEGARELLA